MSKLGAGLEGDRGVEHVHCVGHSPEVPVSLCGKHGSGAGLWAGDLPPHEGFQVKLNTPGTELHQVCTRVPILALCYL